MIDWFHSQIKAIHPNHQIIAARFERIGGNSTIKATVADERLIEFKIVMIMPFHPHPRDKQKHTKSTAIGICLLR